MTAIYPKMERLPNHSDGYIQVMRNAKKTTTMKKILLFILISLSLSSYGQTSVYHSFPDSSAVWNIRDVWNCWLPPYDAVQQDYSITFSNDTIIGSQLYHK